MKRRLSLSLVAVVVFAILAALIPNGGAMAQEGTVSQSFSLEVSEANIAQFEEAYLRHIDWHRQHNDTWTWNMWSSTTGDLGSYVVITGGHTWADFDTPPFDPMADGADAMAQFGSLVESVSSGFGQLMPDVSRPADGPMPLVQVVDFKVKYGMDGDFLQVVRKVTEAAEQVNWTEHYLWLKNVSGGEGNYILVLQHENWASFAQPEMSVEAVTEEVYGRQESTALWDMFFNVVESTSERIWTYRPDLSYTPGN